jgi:hypothetical protein
MSEQLSLFGDVAQSADDRRAAFLARCQVGTVASPHDWQFSTVKAGDRVPAWVCPECGGVELTEFALEINHGWSEFSAGWACGCLKVAA